MRTLRQLALRREVESRRDFQVALLQLGLAGQWVNFQALAVKFSLLSVDFLHLAVNFSMLAVDFSHLPAGFPGLAAGLAHLPVVLAGLSVKFSQLALDFSGLAAVVSHFADKMPRIVDCWLVLAGVGLARMTAKEENKLSRYHWL